MFLSFSRRSFSDCKLAQAAEAGAAAAWTLVDCLILLATMAAELAESGAAARTALVVGRSADSLMFSAELGAVVDESAAEWSALWTWIPLLMLAN